MGTVITAVYWDIKKLNAERKSETKSTVTNTQTTIGKDEMTEETIPETTATMIATTPETGQGTIVIEGLINPNTTKSSFVKHAVILDIQQRTVIDAPKEHRRTETFHTINRTNARTPNSDGNSKEHAIPTLQMS